MYLASEVLFLKSVLSFQALVNFSSFFLPLFYIKYFHSYEKRKKKQLLAAVCLQSAKLIISAFHGIFNVYPD